MSAALLRDVIVDPLRSRFLSQPQASWLAWLTGDWAEHAAPIWKWLTGDFVT